ncbi:hypothetical protein DL96DRAFT_1788040 [Flagelloscypha sp. PMI_526]|nr:hypothetical protein DL96DRAFT_1788040 [Flagelloscypha sp. PMI_526]
MKDDAILKAAQAIEDICERSNGRSQVFRSGSHGYLSGIRHHYQSSVQNAWISVEPGSTEDLSDIMKVIAKHPCKFAVSVYPLNMKSVSLSLIIVKSMEVKGGGHTSNPGFSSTTGIHISMSRFNEIKYDDTTQSLAVGAGCVFHEIYRIIRPKNRNIVGGGGSVGIGGWILGGGYSLKTNQYGLGIDNVVEIQLVLPNGAIIRTSENSNPQLFWAVRGGGNNFGVATEFVLKTHPQGSAGNGYAYTGILSYDEHKVVDVKNAITAFTEQIQPDNPKATLVAAFRYYRNHGKTNFKFTVLAYYDDKRPERDPFSSFLAIRHSGVLTNSRYVELDKAMPLLSNYVPGDFETVANLDENGRNCMSTLSPSKDIDDVSHCSPADGPDIAGSSIVEGRTRWGNIMVSGYTPNLIEAIEHQAKTASRYMEHHDGKVVVADIWPFHKEMFRNSKDTAWPHNKPNGPLLVYFMWEGRRNDQFWIDTLKDTLKALHNVALAENCTTENMPVYSNTALAENTSLEQIYRQHLPKLSSLRAKFDSEDVMRRTGGFRVPIRTEKAPNLESGSSRKSSLKET